VMYADRMTESMKVAIDETDRRRTIQTAYNVEHGIEPQTIIKEIRDINDRLRAVAETPGAYGASSKELAELSKNQIEKMVNQLEAEMRSAAKQLEFERAAAIRDEIQTIRLRVLDEDASTVVLKAAERAGREGSRSRGTTAGAAVPTGEGAAKPTDRMAARKQGERGGRRAEAQMLEVTEVEVLPAGEEPGSALHEHGSGGEPDQDTAADWLPGLRDEHEGDDSGWMARWLDRSTWDRSVTPNVVKRTGTRPTKRRR